MNEQADRIKSNKRASKILISTMVALFGAVAVVAVLLSLPRNIVDLTLYVEPKNYKAGDTLLLETTGQTFAKAESSYDRRIICRGAVEQRHIINTIFVNTTPRPAGKSTTEFEVPKNIMGEQCVLSVVANNKIEILPFLTKTVVEVTESNVFAIEEE